MRLTDPFIVGKRVSRLCNRGNCRRFYKVRVWDQGYNGVVTTDMVGCNLLCGFCWVFDDKKPQLKECQASRFPFQTPEETYEVMTTLAKTNGVERLRISGCEPLLNIGHTSSVMRMAMSENYCYVLDTNALLLDETFLKQMKPFADQLYIYVGLKGATPELFEQITRAPAKYWYKQIEGLRLIVKHGFTLGVNVIANLTPVKDMEFLLKTLYKASPILPLCVDMKECILFRHCLARIRNYGLQMFSPSMVKRTWDTLLEQRYGQATNLLEIFRQGQTEKAFDRYELKILQKHVEWKNDLKFVRLPDVPFSIPVKKSMVEVKEC